MPDIYDLWEAQDIVLERRRARRPKCRLCGEHIQQEDAVVLFGEWYCDGCLKKERVWIEEDD